VTHHFFQQQKNNTSLQNALLESIEMSRELARSPPSENPVVQFDLANQVTEAQLNNTYHGRKKVHNDLCKDAKEALVWNPPDSPLGRAGNKKKSMV
jgi:hypothetical protein